MEQVPPETKKMLNSGGFALPVWDRTNASITAPCW